MNTSSTCALSAPVWVHCAMKRVLDRLATPFMMNSDSGMVTSAMIASTGEITNIMITVPMIVSVEVSIMLSDCWRLCATLSMSLVTRLSRSPRGWRST